MKIPAILAIFAPWLLFFGTRMDLDMARTWTLLSPFWIGGAILFAYREGQWSVK